MTLIWWSAKFIHYSILLQCFSSIHRFKINFSFVDTRTHNALSNRNCALLAVQRFRLWAYRDPTRAPQTSHRWNSFRICTIDICMTASSALYRLSPNSFLIESYPARKIPFRMQSSTAQTRSSYRQKPFRKSPVRVRSIHPSCSRGLVIALYSFLSSFVLISCSLYFLSLLTRCRRFPCRARHPIFTEYVCWGCRLASRLEHNDTQCSIGIEEWSLFRTWMCLFSQTPGSRSCDEREKSRWFLWS